MSKPLNILTVANVPPDPNSGAAGTVWHTNVALRELGHTVDEIWADQLGPRRIQHGNLHSLLEQPRAYRREVKKAIAQKKYDVIQMSQPQAWMASKYLKQSGYRGIIVNRSHGLELRVDDVIPGWHRKLGVSESRFPLATSALRALLSQQWSSVVRWCDGIIVGCELDREYLLQKLSFPDHHIQAIAHGVANEFLVKGVPEKKNEFSKAVLHVGQFAFFKGGALLPEIINRLLNETSCERFTWVCSASDHPRIKSSLDDTVKSRVELLEWMPLEELCTVYDRHDIFVFPSLFEGFGKAPFEAMARGLCVVTADEGGMHDHITHQQDGYLCEVGNVGQFVETIERLLGMPEQIQEVGRNARESACEFSWKRCAEKAVEFYEELLIKTESDY